MHRTREPPAKTKRAKTFLKAAAEMDHRCHSKRNPAAEQANN
jgi:hypothetical protein